MSKGKNVLVKLILPAEEKAQVSTLGAALGQKGIQQKVFRDAFGLALSAYKLDKTTLVGVDIIVDENKTVIVKIKGPTSTSLIKSAINLKKGSDNPKKNIVGTLTTDQLKNLAEQKMPFTNGSSIEAVMKTLAGTARAMGVSIV